MIGDDISLRKTHKRYGNIRIIYENDRYLFTIGPDCNLKPYL